MAMNLGLTRKELREEVGRFLGYGRDYDAYHVSEKEDVNAWIRRGLRQFYSPPPVPGATKSHEWNFLRPTATLDLVASTSSYVLPEEVQSIVGNLVYASEQMKPPVQILNYQRFLQAKTTNPTRTGRPAYGAVTPVHSTDVSPVSPPQVAVELWPTPDQAYTLTYRYLAAQQDAFDEGTITIRSKSVTLTDTDEAWPSWIEGALLSVAGEEHVVASRDNDTSLTLATDGPSVTFSAYSAQPNTLPGGAQHAETIIASCLAIAEEYGETPSTRYRDMFMSRLMASIAIDGQGFTSENLGQNLDRSDGPMTYNKYRLADYNVAVDGVIPS
jgi:hypothetical protein